MLNHTFQQKKTPGNIKTLKGELNIQTHFVLND